MTASSPGPVAPSGEPEKGSFARRDPVGLLRLLARTAAAADGQDDLSHVARLVLPDVRDTVGWAGLALCVVDGGALRPVEAVPAGISLGGPAAQRAHSSRGPAGPDEGILAVPVLVGGDVVAVMEARAEPSAPATPEPDVEADLALLAAVACQLASVVERSREASAVRRAEDRLAAVSASARDAIVTSDEDGRVVDANPAAARIFGIDTAELCGRPVLDLVAEHQRDSAEPRIGGRAGASPEPFELAGRRADGSEFPIEVTTAEWLSSGGRFLTAVIRDISERRKAERDRDEYERQLTQRALHDPLTFLPNRALLHDRVEHALELAARRDGVIALVCLDIDRFKVVNDSLGLAVGDQLLRGVSERLKAVVRPGDTLARTGGDEFAVLFDEVEGRAEADRFAERVQGALANAFDVSGREVPLTACLGVAVAPGTLSSADQVLRDAGVALDRARARGMGQRETFDAAMRGGPVDRLAVEGDLRRAIRQAQLRLFYQPIVEVGTGSMIGVEALIRWQHPTRGLLLPSQFIALAEDSGLIVPLGAWVLEEAIEQLAQWQLDLGEAGPAPRVSVNVSARQFQQEGWTKDVAGALSAARVDPAQVVLEITESILVQDAQATAERLRELRALGVGIAIDDFGTGYSSLGYLRHFPVDILKIDKSFIDGVALGPHESALAHAVIKLAANLGLTAVAEGVSARRQFEVLRQLGCSYAQGYYFGRPQPPESVPGLFARRSLIPDEAHED